MKAAIRWYLEYLAWVIFVSPLIASIVFLIAYLPR